MTRSNRDVSGFVEGLATLKPFPEVVAAVRRVASDPRAGVADVVRLVERDVGVAADVLRVANAPTSGLMQRCTSVRHAATLLGMDRVVELVTSAAVLAVVEGGADRFPMVAAHALAVAGVARALAPITGISEDEAFTAGLLHDVGVLAILQSDDPFYEGLFEMDLVDEPSVDDERAVMGFDHAALGAALARRWNLPSPLPEVVELHHDWSAAAEAGGKIAPLVALVRVADRLAPMLRDRDKPSLDELGTLFEEPAFSHLGVTREELHGRWEELRWSASRAAVLGPGGEVRARLAEPPPANAPAPAAFRPVAPPVFEEPRPTWTYVAAGVAVLGAIAGFVFLS